MRIYNRYLLLLILFSCVINVVLAFLGQNDIGVYFIFNVLAFLLITVLTVYFSPGTRKTLSVVSFVFFSGFLVVVALKVMEILS